MRFALLLAGLFGTSACNDDLFGANIEVSGDIAFDHVEVFFGDEAGFETPLTPRRLAPDFRQPPGETQLLFRRALVGEGDTAMVHEDDAPQKTPDASATSWSYFIPYRAENQALGRYALVVVSRAGQDVGAAELFDFEVPRDAVHRYILPIEPLANEDFERWGESATCLRWTRTRRATLPQNAPDTIAIVEDPTNADCDAFRAEDCDDLRYCDMGATDPFASGCFARDACLIEYATGGCAAGNCLNRVVGEVPACVAATCIDTRLCTACGSADPDAIVACAATSGIGAATHPDLAIPLLGPSDNRTLCSKPTYDLMLDLPVPCIAPEVEAVQNYYNPPVTDGPLFSFEIFATGSTNTCKLKVTEPSPGARWIGTPHLVVSVQNPAGAELGRTRFAFGLYDTGVQCNATNTTVFNEDIVGCGN